MQRDSHSQFRKQLSQSGMSLLETMIALAILLIVTVGILTMGMVATSSTENRGHLAARATEYAQDKMEQLISLAWGDTTTDTTVFPAVSTGGTGLAIGGNSSPDSPAASYVDYLDASGNLLTITGGVVPSNWFYIRVWQISSPATNIKQITVTSRVRRQVGAPQGALPQSTLTTLKTSPF
jgi:prepilin-type N-terminal cleavage/methylation domain-containing protein